MTTKRTYLTLLALLLYGLVIVLVYVWVMQEPERRANTSLAELARNQQKWLAQGTNHYQFTLEVSCLCFLPGPLAIEVRNGTAVSITTKDGESIAIVDRPDAGPDSVDYVAPFTTVDRMFAYAQKVLSDGEDFNAAYDPELGFPTRKCFHDCGHLTPPVVDGGIALDVRDFKKLP